MYIDDIVVTMHWLTEGGSIFSTTHISPLGLSESQNVVIESSVVFSVLGCGFWSEDISLLRFSYLDFVDSLGYKLTSKF